jgi:hypothetical protein
MQYYSIAAIWTVIVHSPANTMITEIHNWTEFQVTNQLQGLYSGYTPTVE